VKLNNHIYYSYQVKIFWRK